MANKPTRIEWMCTLCGRKIIKGINEGKPVPGTVSSCPKKKNKIHSWVKNRKF